MNEDLISRSALLEKLGERARKYEYSERTELTIYEDMHEVKNAPAVDAVEVIRCKDCIIRYDLDECPMCFSFGGKSFEFTQDDGFCHRGERRIDYE